MCYICFYTTEFESNKDCIDLSHRSKCLNKGNKLKQGFDIMPDASKERLFCSDCQVSR